MVKQILNERESRKADDIEETHDGWGNSVVTKN